MIVREHSSSRKFASHCYDFRVYWLRDLATANYLCSSSKSTNLAYQQGNFFFIHDTAVHLFICLQNNSWLIIATVANCLTPLNSEVFGLFGVFFIAQKHISLKVGSSYPTSKAVELMEEAERLGFGSIEMIATPNNRSARRFKKRPIADLSPESQELLTQRSGRSQKIYT